MSRSVVVIGGGLAGLVAARHLADGGVDVTLYEADETVGGRVTTHTEGGYTLDRGFQVLFTAYPAVQRELDLAALDLRRFSPGATIARPGSRSVLADPLGDPSAALASLLTTEVTTTDKLRTLALRQDLSTRTYDDLLQRPDTSIRGWLREWGFSEQYINNFIAPFYGGITLDRSLSTSKRVFEYTFKALSDGESAVPAEGMAAIPRQLATAAADAGATIQTGEAVTELTQKRRHAVVVTDNDRRAVDAVVVATGPRQAARLTDCAAIPTEGIGCVTQHYRLPAADSLDTGRRLLLNAGGSAPNTVVPVSTVARVRARRYVAAECDVPRRRRHRHRQPATRCQDTQDAVSVVPRAAVRRSRTPTNRPDPVCAVCSTTRGARITASRSRWRATHLSGR